MKQAVFILGAARSATTAMLRLLETSNQAACRLEPPSHLNHESRLMWDGLLTDPYKPLIEHVLPRMAAGFQTSPVYIEKQISLIPFMRHLHDLTGCKFLLMKRAGPLTVRSMLNWHNNLFPIFYQEAHGTSTLSPQARAAVESQQRAGTADPFDQSLPRPRANEEYAKLWPYLDRPSMLAYYWNRVNLEMLRQASSLPPEACRWVDATDLDLSTIRGTFEFLGLDDFEPDRINPLLERKINSLEDRLGSKAGLVTPPWDDDSERRVLDFASVAMRALGYVPRDRPRPKPEAFGRFWTERDEVAWFEETYAYREPLHDMFKSWFLTIHEREPIVSVADVGFGIGVGYLDFFEDFEFNGIESNPSNVDYCKRHSSNRRHRFLCHDVISDPPEGVYDLVFSHSTIDNVHDPDVFLRNLCRMTGKFLYVSSYRGYFPKFRQHQITWDAGNRVYFNDLAASEIKRILREEGFEQFAVFPQLSHRDDIPTETVIIASRIELDPSTLLSHHGIWQHFRPYQALDSGKPLAELLAGVNRSCDHFSRDPLLADGLDYFGRMLLAILDKENLRPGPLRDLAKSSGRTNLALRVDVDMDLVTAIEMARIARSVGIGMSFYLLHTAPYYGEWRDGTFYRNDSAAEAYRAIQGFDCEIGLHTDALTVYLDQLVDGAFAVWSEIHWLRYQGLDVRGTAAHNCAPVYGAENFEVFRSRVIGERASTVRDDCYLPLGRLEEGELELEYEANFAKPSSGVGTPRQESYLAGLPLADFNRNPRWMRTFLLDNPHCEWGFDYRIWHLGGDFWIVAGHRPDRTPVFEFGPSWDDVSAFLDTVTSEETAVLVLHPAFFGKRWNPFDYPLLAETSITLAHNSLQPREPEIVESKEPDEDKVDPETTETAAESPPVDEPQDAETAEPAPASVGEESSQGDASALD